jgi:hypothetical protein
MARPPLTALCSLFAMTALAAGLGAARADVFPDLDQGWSEPQQRTWYDATQGSRLVPLSWLKALEQPGGTGPFLADDHIAKFRYLPRPGALPVGFAIDNTDDETLSVTKLRWKGGQGSGELWVGMNCAACHTSEITFRGQRRRIDGGATLADFQGLMETLNRALAETRDDPQKFSRFASAVLVGADTELNRESLQGALAQLVSWQLKVETMNATELRYGPARLDAFGHIFNKVALVVDAPNLKPSPSDAPVSYPFLWNVPQQDWVQWNGIAPSKEIPTTPIFGQRVDVGALARNAGEVIGVFADIKPKPFAGVLAGIISGYPSSIQVSSLISMEQMLGSLRPPAWPSIFDPPNADLVSKGRGLFQTHCQSCHAPLPRTDLSTPITIKMSLFSDGSLAPGTDPWMACNVYVKTAQTGVLRNTPREFVKGDPLGPVAPVADMLSATVAGALAAEKREIVEAIGRSLFGRQPPPVVVRPPRPMAFGVPEETLSIREQQLNRCMTEKSRTLGYKARPLTGIWATPPYLHNGSVPTLYDLLLPAEKRPRQFWIGSREFNPKEVGYVTDERPDNPFLFRTRDASGRVIDGNSNAGHEYGAVDLAGDDAAAEANRRALVEYLKTL